MSEWAKPDELKVDVLADGEEVYGTQGIDGGPLHADGYALSLSVNGEGLIIEGFESREHLAHWLRYLAFDIDGHHYPGKDHHE